jgi:hypothetical protein
MQKKCPICGSEDVEERTTERRLSLPYGPDSTYKAVELYCEDCEEFTTDREGSDEARSQALASCKTASLNAMLDYFSERGITNAYLERALDLPVRTVARWKGGKYSASSLALLRMVRTFEWLLEVAQANYREPASSRIMLENSVKMIVEQFTSEHKLAKIFTGSADLGSSAGAVFQNTENGTLLTFGLYETTATPDSVMQSLPSIISSTKSSPPAQLSEIEKEIN